MHAGAAAVATRGNLRFDVGRLLRTLRDALRSPAAPRIAATVAALALIGTVLRTGQGLYDAYSAGRAASAEYPASTQVARADGAAARDALHELVAAHLFGIGGRPLLSASTRDNALVLTGTISTNDPTIGYALIGPSREKARLHPVGAPIDGSAVLRAVYADRVVIERAGQLATVFFPRKLSLLASRQTALAAGTGPTEVVTAEPSETPQEDVAARLEQENERTGSVLREEPYFSQGQFRGIRIEPGADPGLLARLGLKPGDVLHHVDGTMVVEADRLDMLRSKLASGQPVKVSVVRPGVGPMDLTLDAGLVAAMVAN